MAHFLQDLRYGFRRLLRTPGFTFIAVLTLGLGIGATTAIFTVVQGVLLRSLPYADPERLVRLWENQPELGEKIPVAPANFLDWQKQATSFEELAAYIGPESGNRSKVTLTGEGEPVEVQGTNVVPNLFSVLGVKPLLGRTFTPDEVGPGKDGVVVISHALWQQRYGGDPGVVGRELVVNRQPRTIIGVMPPGFYFPTPEVRLWAPFGFDYSTRRRAHMFHVIGRLKPGVSLERAGTEMATIAAQLEQEYPRTNTELTVGLAGLQEWIVGDIRPALRILFGMAAFVLLIACVNVANLLLSRATSQTQEIAIRSALGARRARIIRQLLAESLVLSTAGGALGVLIASAGVRLLRTYGPAEIPRLTEIQMDGRILAFALGVTIATALITGLAPALQTSRADLSVPLKESGDRGGAGASGNWTRNLLVVAETALAVVLVVSAGLIAKSFARLNQVDPGFEPENLLAFNLSLPSSAYPENEQTTVFFQRLVKELETLPGVKAVGAVPVLPLKGKYWSGDITIEGQPPSPTGEEKKVWHQEVTPDYFEAAGIRIVQGRSFTLADDAEAPLVTMVNQAFVREFLPGRNPLGVRLKFAPHDREAPWWTIVGVIADVKQDSLSSETAPEAYEHLPQSPESAMNVVIRTAVPPMSLVAPARQVVHRLDPDVAIAQVQTGEQLVSESVTRQRFVLALLSAFAGIALVLAAVGIYGVMSYSVAQRTREVGIRMAMGARAGEVLSLILRRGMALVGIGIAIGLVASIVWTRLLGSLLFQVGTNDPATFAIVAFLLAATALLATYLPARRATRIDPLTALRSP